MLLLQFSTSHYCRKARLALGYKKISYQVKNLNPGLHVLQLKPMTGLTTVPVLIPDPQTGKAIADSTRILNYLESHCPEPTYFLAEKSQQIEASMVEDWLDESIGTATRFVYYDYRSGAGKQINPSLFSQVLIAVVQKQYGINQATVELAASRLAACLEELSQRWQKNMYLVGDRFSIADIAAAALLSPLALIPNYRSQYPWLFERITQIHQLCGEPLPPGIAP